MEKGIFVKDIKVNGAVNGVFAVKSASLSDSRNGSFWKLELSDNSGTLAAMIWSPLSQRYSQILPGSFVAISAQAQLWREKIQLNIKSLNPLSENEQINMYDFLPASPVAIPVMERELLNIAEEEFTYAPWRKLVFGVLEDESIFRDFRIFPAARSIHQPYAGGLLEHSLAVCRLCRAYCDLYPSLDRQTLLAASILHDIGKIREFTGGIFNDYTTPGSLVGHITLGLDLLAPHIQKSGLPRQLSEHFTHLVLSHHGAREYGSPVLPQTPEAFALHTADLTDARLSQCRELFAEAEQQPGTWSAWQSSLDRKLFNPVKTPEMPQPRPVASDIPQSSQYTLPIDIPVENDPGFI